MKAQTIAECMKLSFADIPFPEVMRKLAGAGVRSYNADLIRLRNTYYGVRDESVEEPLPLAASPEIAEAFDAGSVAESVRAIQRQQIGYAEFLRRIMAAGCAHYEVFIDGHKAMYFGRNGDVHIEPFPSGK